MIIAVPACPWLLLFCRLSFVLVYVLVLVCVFVCACGLRVVMLLQVGASLSMVYKTRQPIVFVGNGQHYTNLHMLNVNFVVRALLS